MELWGVFRYVLRKLDNSDFQHFPSTRAVRSTFETVLINRSAEFACGQAGVILR